MGELTPELKRFICLSAVLLFLLALAVFVWSHRTEVVDRQFEQIKSWQSAHEQKDGHREHQN